MCSAALALDMMEGAMKQRKIPTFRSEAAKAGTLKMLTRGDLVKRLSSSRVFSVRLPEDDLARLRRLAARNGLPYQTYMKSLLHQALEKEEKRRAS
jgi:predicted DNA binding CopG/RHH family protein